MNTHTTTLNFTTSYGKPVDMNVTRDRYGELQINWLKIGKSFYSGNQIRTARREAALLSYAAQYIDLNEHLADELHERETFHFID